MGILWLILLIIVINQIIKFIYSLTRVSRKNKESKSTHNRWNGQTETQPKKKIFSDDEGEYVDFEELPKDDKQ